MIANVELTEEEIADLRELTHASDTAAAVRLALDGYRSYARRMLLKEVSGQLVISDNWREMEAAETNAPGPH